MSNEQESTKKLIILYRHGLAEEAAEGQRDEDRALTDEGHLQTRQRSRGLARLVKRPDVILASPLLRAAETAVWLSEAWKKKVEISVTGLLAPGSSPDELIRSLEELDGRRIIAVGHEPGLTAIMAAMTGLPAEKLSLSKDGCYGIEQSSEGGELKFLFPPKALDRAGRKS